MKKIRIVQVNLGKRDGAINELSRLLASGEVDIALIQEPRIRDKNVIKIPGVKLYKAGCKPRSCIWISNNLNVSSKCVLRNDLSTRDIVTINLNIQIEKNVNKEMIISSVYLPHIDDDKTYLADPVNNKIKEIIEYCKLTRKEFIIAGDFNSSNTIWGSKKSNSRGVNLVDYIISEDLNIANVGNKPTWSDNWLDPNGKQSVIDLTLSSHGIARKIHNWHVSDDIIQSDHKAIKFELKSEKFEPEEVRYPKKTNFEGFIKDLSERLIDRPEPRSAREIEIQASQLSKQIFEAYENNCRLVKFKEKFNCIWMNREVCTSRQILRRAWNKSKRTKKRRDSERFKKIRKEHNELIDKLQHESWKSTMEELEGIKECARWQKFFEKGPSRKMGNIKKPDGTYTNNMEESLEALIECHFSGSTLINDEQDENLNNEVRPQITISKEQEDDINATVSAEKIEEAIEEFGPYKTAGSDGIFPALLQKGKKFSFLTWRSYLEHY